MLTSIAQCDYRKGLREGEGRALTNGDGDDPLIQTTEERWLELLPRVVLGCNGGPFTCTRKRRARRADVYLRSKAVEARKETGVEEM